MSTNKTYNANEICKELNISSFTLANWYNWEKKMVDTGIEVTNYLPKPERLSNVKGRPRVWTHEMLIQLREYQKSIVTGRNGIYGAYSNPNHKSTKKYKKSIETVEKS